MCDLQCKNLFEKHFLVLVALVYMLYSLHEEILPGSLFFVCKDFHHIKKNILIKFYYQRLFVINSLSCIADYAEAYMKYLLGLSLFRITV